jgi:MFS family permease
VGQYGLECDSKKAFAAFGSLYFTGVVIGSLILPRIGDKYSRKRIALIGNLIHLFSATWMLLSQSYSVALWCNFAIGFSLAGRSFVGYAWLAENLRAEDMPWVTVWIFGGDSMTLFSTTLYFRYISKDWTIIYGLPLIVHCFSIFAILNQKDGPKYDYGHQNYEKCRMKLTNIGRLNGVL